jgi:hypothetical protein
MDDSEKYFLTNFSPESLQDTFNKSIKNKTGKGIDGVGSVQIEKDLALITSKISSKVLNSKYRFSPYLEIVKSKGRGKHPRIISKPTIRDKLTLSGLKDTLHYQYEHGIQNQLPNTYIREIKKLFNEHGKEEIHYLKIDIKGFYDNLNHQILLGECLSDIKNEHALTLIRRAIKNKTVPKNYKKANASNYHNTVGVPQGLSISNVLAGIYMKDFDIEYEVVGLKYFRYVDDILIFAKQDEIKAIEEKVDDSLNLIGLETNDKTEKGVISKSFDYLGYRISSEKISVRESTVERFINSIIAMFTDFKLNFNSRVANSKWFTAENIKALFILNINEKITGAVTETKRYGWIFYFTEITDIHLLHKLDSIISKQFSRLEMFDAASPQKLKTMVKSHYSAKYSPFDGYIHNYNIYDTVINKIQFLLKFGYISEQDIKNFTEEEIERKFETAKGKRLVKLEDDIDNIS